MKYVVMLAGALVLLMGNVQLSVAADGKAVYDAKCGSCHNKGMMGAPKLGEKDKLKGDAAAMEASVLKGKGKMPAQKVSPEEAKAAVEYMMK